MKTGNVPLPTPERMAKKRHNQSILRRKAYYSLRESAWRPSLASLFLKIVTFTQGVDFGCGIIPPGSRVSSYVENKHANIFHVSCTWLVVVRRRRFCRRTKPKSNGVPVSIPGPQTHWFVFEFLSPCMICFKLVMFSTSSLFFQICFCSCENRKRQILDRMPSLSQE